MSRITTVVLITVLLLNGGVTIMEASGYSDDIGVELNTGVDESMENTVAELKKGFSPDVTIVESFISLAIAGLNVFQLVVEGALAAPTAIINILGGSQIVEVTVGAFAAVLYVVSTLEILSIALGNRTV